MRKFNELTMDDKQWLLNENTGLTMNDYPNIEDYANEAVISAFCDIELSVYDACKFVDMYDDWSGFDEIIHKIFSIADIDYKFDKENEKIIIVDNDNNEMIETFYDIDHAWEWFEDELGI